MIGKTTPRGKNLYGVLSYLFGPGGDNQHINARIVAGWRPPAVLQPPLRDDGTRALGHLDRLMRAPLKLLDSKPAKFVYHLVLSAAPEDRFMDDGEWMRICEEAMHRTGLDPRDPDRAGVPWVAVRHDDGHVHIVAVLARCDGTRAHLHNDWYRINEACRWAEKEYGLRVIRADRTAARRPTRAEQEKAARSGLAEPPRVTLARTVRSAAAAARDEAEFLALLEQSGLAVRLRTGSPSGDVTGYAVGQPGDLGPGGGQVWFGGGRLAPDLSLPKLRRRWSGTGPGRLTGRAMGSQAAGAALAREVTRAARAARTEAEFFGLLARAGLLTRYTDSPGQAGRRTGYSVTLPGLVTQASPAEPGLVRPSPAQAQAGRPGPVTPAGQPAWHDGESLGPGLGLGKLRAGWLAGPPITGPGPELFDGAERAAIYEHAARATQDAANMISRRQAGHRDAAWAAADVLTAAAMATRNPALRQAAEEMQRAAREPWGRIPTRTPHGDVLRTAAYLLARCRRGRPDDSAVAGLLIALAALAVAVAILRARQHRHHQAAIARVSAARVTSAIPVPASDPPSAPGIASLSFTARATVRRPARQDPEARLPSRPATSRTGYRPRGVG